MVDFWAERFGLSLTLDTQREEKTEMLEDEKTITATKNDNELDAIQYGLIAGWVFVVSVLIFAAILVGHQPGL
jgi:hypothetical protein